MATGRVQSNRGSDVGAMPRRWSPVDLVPHSARLDVTHYLTIWLVLLFGIPATQVIGPLGAIGSPALVFAGGAVVFWIILTATPDRTQGLVPFQPLRPVILSYVWFIFATIAMAHTRPLTMLEQTGSVREGITMVVLGGVALLVMDGVDSIERLTTLLRRMVAGGAFLAGVGLLQFFSGRRIIIELPGLSTAATRELGQRSIFNRPYGTSMHPIEFSVVLAAMLPLALYFALESPPGSRQRTRAFIAVGLIALSVPLSISRSGLLTVVVAMAVLMLSWGWRWRLQAMVVGVLAIPVLWLSIPGLVGTIKGMFTGVDSDPSIQARLDRVPRIMDIIRDQPWLGLGAGTFSVEDYFLVDNEFWVSTMETGIIGITFTIGLLVLAIVMAITSKHHRYATPSSVHLGFAIAASIAGLSVSIATFDAFFYHILRGMLFLLLGASGALWRLTKTEELTTW